MSIARAEPITDRSQEDIDRLKYLNTKGYFNMSSGERAEWARDSKGALNESDFVRVETNIHFISDFLGLSLTTLEDSIPYAISEDYINNLKDNLETLKATEYVKASTPDVPENPLQLFEWNKVEQILKDVYERLNESGFIDSTEALNMGESIGLIL